MSPNIHKIKHKSDLVQQLRSRVPRSEFNAKHLFLPVLAEKLKRATASLIADLLRYEAPRDGKGHVVLGHHLASGVAFTC